MDFDDYGLPHEYNCTASREQPDSELSIRIPPVPLHESGDYVYVNVFPEDGRPWTAAVLREGNGMLDAVTATPEPVHACVVAGGVVYLIDTRDRDAWRRLDVVVPGMAAFGSPNDGLLLLASFHKVFAVNAQLDVAWATDLDCDGIEFASVVNGILSVRAYMPGYGDWVSRAISLTDGTLLPD
ncbi:MAG: hypothetical protein WB805_07255 [Candidatus Dormiibacterota bacterium]